MHTHRLHLVRLPADPKGRPEGWVFGTIGPAVQHRPAWVPPGGWVWFVTDHVAVVTAHFQPEPLKS